MEVDHIVEKEEVSDEEKEQEEVLDPIEMNNFDSVENKDLIVGIYGNGYAFIKSSLLLEIKASKAFKIKFMIKNKLHKHLAKKLICELYQINHNNNYHLVLLTKNYLDGYFFNEILDHINQKYSLKYNNIIIADSIYTNKLIANSAETKSCMMNKLFYLKNSAFNHSLNLDLYPFPNKVRGFTSYLFTYAEIFKISCVVVVSSQEEYQINHDSISLFNSFAETNELLKGKITEEYLTTNKINLRSSVFTELDFSNKIIYT